MPTFGLILHVRRLILRFINDPFNLGRTKTGSALRTAEIPGSHLLGMPYRIDGRFVALAFWACPRPASRRFFVGLAIIFVHFCPRVFYDTARKA